MQAVSPRIERILCATDFSEPSARALRHAAGLRRRFDARLSVLHVIPFVAAPGASIAYFPTLPLIATPELRQRADEQLRHFVAPLLAEGHPLALELREGDPAHAILESAGATDLLVMGSHGRGILERLLVGSVAEHVLRRAACPVLTVSHEREGGCDAHGSPSRILCAVDLSAGSGHTVGFAASLAALCQSQLTLVHVLEGRLHWEQFRSDPRQWAGQELARAVGEETRACCDVEERIEQGHPSKRIVELADELAADLIVIGRHAPRLLDVPIFGTTALHVVRAAGCPVLSIRPPAAVAALASAGR
jgi:nucleotide-binding universal stress UspA family protein